MQTLTDFILTAMTTAGPLALGLALLLGPLGVPIPTGLLLLAAGALARQGLMPLGPALGISLVATVAGDVASYGLGRLAGGWTQRLAGRRAVAWEKARRWFQERGGLALYLTRVVLTSLDVPTNLIAGSSRYAFGRFVLSDVAGRLTWLLLYGGLGYLFGSQWPVVAEALNTYGLWIGIGGLMVAGLYALLRRWGGAGLLRRWREDSEPRAGSQPSALRPATCTEAG